MDVQERRAKRVDMGDKKLQRKSYSKNLQRSETSVNPLKKRQRDLTRLLAHTDNLPADVKIGYERELASCRHDLEIAQGRLYRNQMIKKYHMVRFFERQKATRFLRQAKRTLAILPDSHDKAALEDEVHNCDVDLNYTMFFPLEQTYTSLYANSKGDMGKHTKESTAARSHPMWKTVEEAMKMGTLQLLREGRTQGSMCLSTNKPIAARQASASRPTSKPTSNGGITRNPAVISHDRHSAKGTMSTTAGMPQNRRTRRKEAANAAIRVTNDSDDDETGGAFFE